MTGADTSKLNPMLEALRRKVSAMNNVSSDLGGRLEKEKTSIAAWAALHGKAGTAIHTDMFTLVTKDKKNREANLWNYISAWIFYVDRSHDELCMLAGTEGMSLSAIIQDDLRDLISGSLRVPYGVGSSGFALRHGQILCLDHVLADPRGTVAIEDLLIGNFSYVAVPIFVKEGVEEEQHADEVLCFVGIVLPCWKAWQGKVDSYKCAASDGELCFAGEIKREVTNAEHAIRMAVHWAREKSIVKAFRKAVKFNKDTLASYRKSPQEWWRQFLATILFEKDITPSPLGVEACLFYGCPKNGTGNTAEENPSPSSSPTTPPARASSYARSDLDSMIRTIVASQEVLINYGASTSNPLNIAWTKKSFDINAIRANPSDMPNDYVADFLNKMLNVQQTPLSPTVEKILVELKYVLWPKDTSQIRLNLYISSPSGTAPINFSEEEFLDSITTPLEALERILSNELTSLGQKILSLNEKEETWQDLVTKRLTHGFRNLACQTFGRWLVGHENPTEDFERTLATFLNGDNKQNMGALSKFVQILSSPYESASSIKLWAVGVWLQEEATWHVSAIEPGGLFPSDVQMFDGTKIAFLDPSVYKVQRFLANATEDDLEHWKVSDTCKKGDTQNTYFRIAAKDHSEHAATRICAGVLGGRAFETELSHLPQVPKIVAARRTRYDADSICISYHTDSNAPEGSLEDICTGENKVITTEWTKKQGGLCAAFCLSDSVLPEAIDRITAHSQPDENILRGICAYYRTETDPWLTYYLNFGEKFNATNYQPTLVWPLDTIVMPDAESRKHVAAYGEYLKTCGVMPYGEWFVTVVPIQVRVSKSEDTLADDAVTVFGLLNLFTRKSKLDPESVSKMKPRDKEGIALLFDDTQRILIEGVVDYAESVVQQTTTESKLSETQLESHEAIAIKKLFETIKPKLSDMIGYIDKARTEADKIRAKIQPEGLGVLINATDRRLENLFVGFHDLKTVRDVSAVDELIEKLDKAMGKENRIEFLSSPMVELWRSEDKEWKKKYYRRVFQCLKTIISDWGRPAREICVAQIIAMLSQVPWENKERFRLKEPAIYLNGSPVRCDLRTSKGTKQFIEMTTCFPQELEEYGNDSFPGNLIAPVREAGTSLAVCSALSVLLIDALKPQQKDNEVYIKNVEVVVRSEKPGGILVVMHGGGRFEHREKDLMVMENRERVSNLATNTDTLAKAVNQFPAFHRCGKEAFSWGLCAPNMPAPGHSFMVYEREGNEIAIVLFFYKREHRS